jgi:hypothetical protein
MGLTTTLANACRPAAVLTNSTIERFLMTANRGELFVSDFNDADRGRLVSLICIRTVNWRAFAAFSKDFSTLLCAEPTGDGFRSFLIDRTLVICHI